MALIAFGAGNWWLIRNLKIERIDSEVRTYAAREVTRARPMEDWQRTEARILGELGLRDSRELLLLVQNADGETIYRSAAWPATLDPDDLPWPGRRLARSLGRGDWLPAAQAGETVPGDPGRPPPPPDETAPDRPDAPGIHPPRRMNPGPPPVSIALPREIDGQVWRFGLAQNPRGRVALAVSSQVIDTDMAGVRNAFLLTLPIALLLIGLASWAFSGRAMRPLKKLAEATRGVTAEGLDRRIPEQEEDEEFIELIRHYNLMLERLERSFGQARRFSADAAHELKTPLAILQGQLERAIQEAGDGSAMQEKLTGILDEVRRLSTISRKLLLLSQADAGGLKIHRESVRLSQVLQDLAEDTSMLAPHLDVRSRIPPGIEIQADSALLHQVLHNLVSNAIKYNIDKGWIEISAQPSPRQVKICIANPSSGIPEADRSRVFERFYRGDPSHARQIEGVGLGLSVSREIARAHGGDITLNVSPDNAVQFVMTIPR